MWKEFGCLIVIVLGIVLFLYGANYYVASAGWTGTGLLVGGVLAYILLRMYKSLTGKDTGQKP